MSDQRITLTNLQQLQPISKLMIKGSIYGSAGYDLASFQKLLLAAKPVDKDDPLLIEWNYSPLYDGTFEHNGIVYSYSLYFGGLGKLETPQGRGYFIYD